MIAISTFSLFRVSPFNGKWKMFARIEDFCSCFVQLKIARNIFQVSERCQLRNVVKFVSSFGANVEMLLHVCWRLKLSSVSSCKKKDYFPAMPWIVSRNIFKFVFARKTFSLTASYWVSMKIEILSIMRKYSPLNAWGSFSLMNVCQKQTEFCS